MSIEIIEGDCLEVLRTMPAQSVDLVFTSPPYEAARTYSIGFDLRGQEWVDWAVERFVECLWVCKGLVAWNVEGQTRNYRWSATPALFMADLHRRGIGLRKPPIFHRIGIPGSGGPDWLRNDYEFVVCATSGKLPWSDNTAMGHPPKWGPGGEMSYRQSNGSRRNKWGKSEKQVRGAVGPRNRNGDRKTLRRPGDDDPVRLDSFPPDYVPPYKANPGNVVKCIVGGGVMGSDLACENEAPFPESLAEFFIRSFCPPNGTVLDPFCGSGTSCAVAKKNGRNAIGIDIRASQIELSNRRCADIDPLFSQLSPTPNRACNS